MIVASSTSYSSSFSSSTVIYCSKSSEHRIVFEDEYKHENEDAQLALFTARRNRVCSQNEEEPRNKNFILSQCPL